MSQSRPFDESILIPSVAAACVLRLVVSFLLHATSSEESCFCIMVGLLTLLPKDYFDDTPERPKYLNFLTAYQGCLASEAKGHKSRGRREATGVADSSSTGYTDAHTNLLDIW